MVRVVKGGQGGQGLGLQSPSVCKELQGQMKTTIKDNSCVIDFTTYFANFT